MNEDGSRSLKIAEAQSSKEKHGRSMMGCDLRKLDLSMKEFESFDRELKRLQSNADRISRIGVGQRVSGYRSWLRFDSRVGS